MKKVFLALLCAGLFVACGNKNKVVEEQPAVDSVVVEEIVEEPVVEEPVVAEEPAPAPAKATTSKKNNTTTNKTNTTTNQTVGEHAKKTGENIGNAALEKVETEAVKEINNATPNKRRR